MSGSVHLICLFSLVVYLHPIFASTGDRSPYYKNCIDKCLNSNCTSNSQNYKKSLENDQRVENKLLLWSCHDECKYECMWKTVDGFLQRGWEIPKFHGKWPFIRIFGIQEIGSVIGSLLNLVSHLLMYSKMVSRFSHHNTPLLWLWKCLTMICVNGWLWSIIFHTRDTPFTEFMDYACAMSMVMVLLVTCGIRLLYFKHRMLSVIFSMACLFYYVDHVIYLWRGKVDYEYNMLANLIPGVMACTMWTLWAFRKYGKGEKYVWRIVWFNVLSGALMALELFDFPPYWHVWDAHALWHLSTAVLPLVFYRFVFDDLDYLRQHWPTLLPKTATKQM